MLPRMDAGRQGVGLKQQDNMKPRNSSKTTNEPRLLAMNNPVSVPTVFALENTELSRTVRQGNAGTRRGTRREIQVTAQFSVRATNARSVAVAGSFNNWDPTKTPLTRQGDRWSTKVDLPRGRYEYRFVVDGQWM